MSLGVPLAVLRPDCAVTDVTDNSLATPSGLDGTGSR